MRGKCVTAEHCTRAPCSTRLDTLAPLGRLIGVCRIKAQETEVVADVVEEHNIHELDLQVFETANTKT